MTNFDTVQVGYHSSIRKDQLMPFTIVHSQHQQNGQLLGESRTDEVDPAMGPAFVGFGTQNRGTHMRSAIDLCRACCPEELGS